MYPIDFTTATAREVILRSLVCHPSLFIDALSVAEREHAVYAQANAGTPHGKAAESAREHASVALSLARDMNAEGAAFHIASHTGPLVQALTISARLQCVPPSLRYEIAGRPGV